MEERINEAEKKMKKKGLCYDGLGKEIAESDKANGEEHNGVILAPENEVNFYRIRKQIRESVVGDDHEDED